MLARRPFTALALRAAAPVLGSLAALCSLQHAAAQPTCGARSFDVYFEQFKDTLDDDAKNAIAASQRSFAGCRITHVRVVGLAGTLGDPESNQALSERRSQVVADLLTSGGWPRSSLELVALGDRGAKVGDAEKPIRRHVHVEVQSEPTP